MAFPLLPEAEGVEFRRLEKVGSKPACGEALICRTKWGFAAQRPLMRLGSARLSAPAPRSGKKLSPGRREPEVLLSWEVMRTRPKTWISAVPEQGTHGAPQRTSSPDPMSSGLGCLSPTALPLSLSPAGKTGFPDPSHPF